MDYTLCIPISQKVALITIKPDLITQRDMLHVQQLTSSITSDYN